MHTRPGYRVENQSGSSDIHQSMAAKLAVSGSKQQPDDAQALQAPQRVRLAGPVLERRPPRQQLGDADPGREIDDGADDEEWHVQVDHLVLKRRIRRHRVWMTPDVQAGQAKQDGYEQHCQQRQRGRASLENPPRDKPPHAARQELDQRYAKTTQRQTEPECIRNQVVAKEPRRFRQRQQNAQSQRHHASGANAKKGIRPATRSSTSPRRLRRAHSVPGR